MRTQTAHIALLFGLCGLLATGCGDSGSREPAKAQPADPHEIISRYVSACEENLPASDRPRIIVGKPMPDLNGNGSYHVSIGDQWLAEPAQIMPSRNMVIDDINYVVLLQEDGMVYSIFTKDIKFRNPRGIGVGSTFAEVKKKYSEHHTYYYPFMEEQFVDVGNGSIYYFPFHSPLVIEDSEAIGHIGLPFIPPVAEDSREPLSRHSEPSEESRVSPLTSPRPAMLDKPLITSG